MRYDVLERFKTPLFLLLIVWAAILPQEAPGADETPAPGLWDQRYRYAESQSKGYTDTWYRKAPSMSAFWLQIWRDEEMLSERRSPVTNRYEFESEAEGSRPLDIGEAAHIQARVGDEMRAFGVAAPDVKGWDWQCFIPGMPESRSVYWTQTPFEYAYAFENPGKHRFYLNTHNGSDWSSYGNYRVFKPKSDTGGSLDYWWYFSELVVDVSEAPPDLAVAELTAEDPALPDSVREAHAWIQNKGPKGADAHVQYYAGGAKVLEETVFIEAGDVVERTFSFETPAAGRIELKASVAPLPKEEVLDDNVKTLWIDVAEEKSKISNCPFGHSDISDSWTVRYVWTERVGKIKRTRSAAAAYSEKLAMDVQINTYQDISTDPDAAQDSDWQSRGSWEIIPYARRNGLKAEEVTRAGYGFEVRVQTVYQTDWETKVPPKSRPFGGTYKGPTSLRAVFYDTKGKKVEEIKLVPTRGSAGDKEVVWELPEKTHVFLDGTSVKERKHFIPVDLTDGSYRVQVLSEPCGRNRLSLCAQKDVVVYGDLYDDLYTRPER
jgi:hypothetical protein